MSAGSQGAKLSHVKTKHGLFEVTSSADGRVWVNGPDGGSVARYSPRAGRDVHTSFTTQRETGVECLDCSHELDFNLFVRALVEHYGLVIPKKHYPRQMPAVDKTDGASL